MPAASPKPGRRGDPPEKASSIRKDAPVRAQQPVFYFGAMSPYSWLAAERIGGVMPLARWKPLFLGGLFNAVGRKSWGLDEGLRDEQMRECERRAARYEVGTIKWPDPWPTNDLYVARGMTFAASRGELQRYALTAMRAAFLQGTDIGSPEAAVQIGREAGFEPAELEAALSEPEVKDALRATTDEAVELGVIGVPTMLVDGELFWGDDRLEEAARAVGPPGAAPAAS
jgi:2-hydroxychromene-2-carboxylate isomerase